MRSNSSTTMSATLGSTRSRSANSDQNCALDPAAAERVRQQAELRAQQPHERLPVAPDEGHGRAQQRQAADALRVRAARPRSPRGRPSSCRPGARARSRARPSRRARSWRSTARRSGAGAGLREPPKPGQVERVDAVAERLSAAAVSKNEVLVAAEAVQEQHVGALAHGQRRDPRGRPDARRRGCAAAAGGRWGGGTCPRSRPRGRGCRGRRGGAAENASMPDSSPLAQLQPGVGVGADHDVRRRGR